MPAGAHWHGNANTPVAPCERGCDAVARCRADRLACHLFHVYVTSGRSKPPPPRPAPTRGEYIKVFGATDASEDAASRFDASAVSRRYKQAGERALHLKVTTSVHRVLRDTARRTSGRVGRLAGALVERGLAVRLPGEVGQVGTRAIGGHGVQLIMPTDVHETLIACAAAEDVSVPGVARACLDHGIATMEETA